MVPLISHLSTERENLLDAMRQRGQQNEDLLNVLIDINSNKRLQLTCADSEHKHFSTIHET